MKFGLLYNAYSTASAVLLVGLPYGNCYSNKQVRSTEKGPYAHKRIIKSNHFKKDEVPDSDYLIQLGDEFVDDDLNSVALSDDGFTAAFGSYDVVKVFQYDSASDAWIQFGSDITGTDNGHVLALSADGSILAVSDDTNQGGMGYVQVFQYSNNAWSQLGSLTGDQDNENCGGSMDLNAAGDIVAFGCESYDNGGNVNVGRVRIFQFSNGSWSVLGSDILGEEGYERCGGSLGLSDSGYIVTVGCGGYGNDAGRARVFQFANGSWSQTGNDIIGEDDDSFGYSGLSLSAAGDVVAGGGGYPLNSGFGKNVRVFQFSDGSWSKIGDISSDIGEFGTSLALSSDATTLIAGGKGDGEAVVYTYSDSGYNWVSRGQILEIKERKSVSRDVAISADGMIISTVYPTGAKVYTFPLPSSSPSMSTVPSAGPSLSAQPSVAGDSQGETSLIPTLSSESCCCCCCEKSGLAKLLFDTFKRFETSESK